MLAKRLMKVLLKMFKGRNKPWSMSIDKVEVADASAIKALANGNADEFQQKRAMQFIIDQASATYDMTFDPDSDRASSFAEGRRHVGRLLVGIINGKLDLFKPTKKRNPTHG